METSSGPEATSMQMDDFFDGWLSVPPLEHLLVDPPIPSTELRELQESPSTSSQAGEHIETPDAAVTAARKRRGHTKSRLGCVNCKKRKVKCQETWPSCANCTKRGYACRYPTIFTQTQHDRIVSEVIGSPRPVVRLSDTPKSYSADDMRLFHHYLITAYPFIPNYQESTWLRDVPAYSHQYDYLMHSILALSGSHLSFFVDDGMTNALSHRQKAIVGLEQAFTRQWPPKPNEAHVMLATSYLLAFQSAYLTDGMMDHILSLRGCAMLSNYILENRLGGVFSVEPSMLSTTLELKLDNLPILDQTILRQGLDSLEKVLSLLQGLNDHSLEKAISAQLVETFRALLLPRQQADTQCSCSPTSDISKPEKSGSSTIWPFVSSSLISLHINNPVLPGELTASFEKLTTQPSLSEVDQDHEMDHVRSFRALMSSLLVLTTWPQEEVLEFLRPSNQLGSVIMAHFCAVRSVIAPLSAPNSSLKIPMMSPIEWTEAIVERVKDDEQTKWSLYMEWPARIVKTLRCCLSQKSTITSGDIQEILLKDPGAFQEGRPTMLWEVSPS
ncbi:hypothetical protein EJ04DRAFT_548107 [Polyplosphaeria fusca]|uniref:Zn(2)-C6 fungal-type domain-containing protein n=1 Tax=Polyplosphaeria fusca TaxID=682080 RepID=A0A9P4V912_9PLEO|nr:hypothetical protein EJ04DRAFT_548107 [Polyplosphaeria fusca]